MIEKLLRSIYPPHIQKLCGLTIVWVFLNAVESVTQVGPDVTAHSQLEGSQLSVLY